MYLYLSHSISFSIGSEDEASSFLKFLPLLVSVTRGKVAVSLFFDRGLHLFFS